MRTVFSLWKGTIRVHGSRGNFDGTRWSDVEDRIIYDNLHAKLCVLIAAVQLVNPDRSAKAISDRRLRLSGNRVDVRPPAYVRGHYKRRQADAHP